MIVHPHGPHLLWATMSILIARQTLISSWAWMRILLTETFMLTRMFVLTETPSFDRILACIKATENTLPDLIPLLYTFQHLMMSLSTIKVYFLSISALLLSHTTSITNGLVQVKISREVTSTFGTQRWILNTYQTMLSSRMALHKKTRASWRISSHMHYQNIRLFSMVT
ncbi:uncharacterized protein F5891DRAFT_67421 [Suillus fuscotomentosus]|uniref:Uncharacterized protein n=1 Tax=Suillus fuscotomentosus TaxID=1912939 RepID=A0AAD4HPK1_9AGAM|nr:uncharacterized protein F5891DRAFT_67421 [Suillus fuscotomentosus]KAG1904122.1 hypothetical protein F5891DRAFT_67421 [Suillus fuscotomentosus]